MFLYLAQLAFSGGCYMCPSRTLPLLWTKGLLPASHRVGSDLCCELSSTDCGIYFSCFCCLPPVGWGWSRGLYRLPSGRDLCVELGLGSLIGSAMSRAVSRGDCTLRRCLGILCVSGWGCIPALFIDWPEAFQHWSLQAAGWGQFLVLMTPARCQPSHEYSWICSPPFFYVPR